MKAANKFKRLLAHKRPDFLHGMFGSSAMVQPPESIHSESDEDKADAHLSRMQTDSLANRKPIEGNLTTEGIIREIEISDNLITSESTDKINIKEKGPITSKGQWGSILRGSKPNIPFHAEPQKDDAESSKTGENSSRPNLSSNPSKSATSSAVESPAPVLSPAPIQYSISRHSSTMSPVSEHGKGQAHDPLEDTLFLHIGTGAENAPPDPDGMPIVSESPSAVIDADIYERAYEEEIQKILAARKQPGRKLTLFLTKRVEGIAHLRDHEDITDFERAQKKPALGFAQLTDIAKSAVAKPRASSASDEVEPTAKPLSGENPTEEKS
jgi:calcium/calmodulin-dependent protein kinase kinase 2